MENNYRKKLLLELHITQNENSINSSLWDLLTERTELSEEFIEEFKEELDWPKISRFQKLSENFIRKYKEEVNWEDIRKFQKLSENFIEEHQNVVDWYYISEYQTLSESFIQKFDKKVDWNYISMYQKLSGDFIEENKNKLDWEAICEYQQLNTEIIDNNKNEIYWDRLSMNLSEEFLGVYKKEIDFNLVFLYREISFKKMKKLILRTTYLDSNDFITSHLTEQETKVIQKMLDVKNTFIRK
jgi:hypothetical protein